MDPDSEIVYDFRLFLCLYKSGCVHRFVGTDYVPACVDSKDVLVDPGTGLSARLYVCCPSASTRRPVLFYCHGGAFVIESAFSPLTTPSSRPTSLPSPSSTAARTSTRSPPDAYDDALSALRWVASHASGGDEAWLAERGDFDRVFLAGDSAGG